MFWNVRLSSVSFLLSLFLLSQLPAHWASCHFHCAGFSLCSASTTGAFTGLGFCCVWPLPCRGRAKVVSARLNLSHGTRYVGTVCNFLCFVSPQQNLKRRTSVLAWLQLRVLPGKQQRKVHPQGVRVGRPRRRGLNPSWLPLFIRLSPPLLEPALCKLG